MEEAGERMSERETGGDRLETERKGEAGDRDALKEGRVTRREERQKAKNV